MNGSILSEKRTGLVLGPIAGRTIYNCDSLVHALFSVALATAVVANPREGRHNRYGLLLQGRFLRARNLSIHRPYEFFARFECFPNVFVWAELNSNERHEIKP